MAGLLLVQLAGAPGSGRSTLARAIAPSIGADVADLDVCKSALLDAGAAWDDADPAAYDHPFVRADAVLAHGTSVIVDSPSYHPNIPTRGLAIAARHAAADACTECRCSAVSIGPRPRLRSQMIAPGVAPRDAARATPTDAIRQGAHRWQTFGPGPERWLTVDTDEPPERCVVVALQLLEGSAP